MNQSRNRSTFLVFSFLLLSFSLISTSAMAQERFRRSWPVMGTYAELEIDHDSPALNRESEQAVREVFRRVNHTMSTYSNQSDLMKVNRRAGQKPVLVDPWLADILRKSKRLARESEGAFSVNVLGYGIRLGLKPGNDSYVLPPADDSAITVDSSRPMVNLEKQGMGLDLGGIAKGYALDRAVEVLKEKGITRFFLSLGRGIYAGEPPRENEGWPVRIGTETEVQILTKQFVSVSEQGIRSDTGHILDPRTGRPIQRSGRMVVYASRGWISDGLSTALFVDPSLRERFLRGWPSVRRVDSYRR